MQSYQAVQPELASELFEAALRRALADPEIVKQRAALGGGTDRRAQLEAELRRQRDDIFLDAAAELEHLETVVDRDEPVAEPDDGIDPALAAEIDTVRAGLAEIEAELQRKVEEEGRLRAEIQGFGSDKEVFKARVAAGLESDEPVARLSALDEIRTRLPFVRRKPLVRTASEEREFEYQRRMEGLQDVKKRIVNVITARKRLQLQLRSLEQRAEKERARRREAATKGSSTPRGRGAL